MGKMRNITFSAVVGIMLLCCIGNVLADAILPDYKLSSGSYLEGRKLMVAPEFTPESISTGEYRDATEQFVADAVPLRNEALLANATLQRQGIATANLAFGFPAYPTFYGSKHALIPEYGAVLAKPGRVSGGTDKAVDRALATYKRLILAHPNTNWVIASPDNKTRSVASPLHDFVSDPLDYEYYKNHLFNELAVVCKIVDLGYTDTELLMNEYFHTDHHWQIQGALRAFNKIAPVLGIPEYPTSAVYRAFDGPFWGFSVREGLCQTETYDVIYDVPFDYESISVYVDGERVDASFLDKAAAENSNEFQLPDTFSDAYGEWFHSQVAKLEIYNESLSSGRLLIIEDSFAHNCERFFSTGYQYVCCLDLRHFDDDLDKFIEDSDFDDVVILISAGQIASDMHLDRM